MIAQVIIGTIISLIFIIGFLIITRFFTTLIEQQ